MLAQMTKIAKQLGVMYPGYGVEGVDKSHELLYFGAIEYPKEDAYFLAGPFEYDNKYYGLVNVTTENNLRSITQILAEARKDSMLKNSDMWIPYNAKQRLRDYYKTCVLYYHKKTKHYFSNIDLAYGINEIDMSVLDQCERFEDVSLYFSTEGARKEILSWLTKAEIAEWESSLTKMADNVCDVLEKTAYSIERPYQIFLYGTDDVSYISTVATEKQWKEFVLKMNSISFVKENMLCT